MEWEALSSHSWWSRPFSRKSDNNYKSIISFDPVTPFLTRHHFSEFPSAFHVVFSHSCDHGPHTSSVSWYTAFLTAISKGCITWQGNTTVGIEESCCSVQFLCYNHTLLVKNYLWALRLNRASYILVIILNRFKLLNPYFKNQLTGTVMGTNSRLGVKSLGFWTWNYWYDLKQIKISLSLSFHL